MCDLSFINPTSTAGLQLLCPWLLKVVIRWVNDGVTTVKPGHKTTGNACMAGWVVLDAVLYIRRSWGLQNITRNAWFQQRNTTQSRFCDGLDSDIVVSVGLILTLRGPVTAREYVDNLGNQVHPMAQALLPNNGALFQDNYGPIHTAGSVVVIWRAWKWTSASSLASTINIFEHHEPL
jgi:hypothetical protein